MDHKYNYLTLFGLPFPVYFWGTVLNCQSTFVNQNGIEKTGTSVSNGGFGPASRTKTLTQDISESLFAKTDPAVPPPTGN